MALPAFYILVGVHNHSLYSLIALSLACFVHIFGAKGAMFCVLNRYIKEEEVAILVDGIAV